LQARPPTTTDRVWKRISDPFYHFDATSI